ncbi:hypothetical protein ACFQZX_08090 [Mucilaginibacter litoreus]|uniref:Uncharacterized protein n=1 Tax=Mucilaginibacter litoreus TaxID=1048221 RepID=A0ABW3AST1_9SPHI
MSMIVMPEFDEPNATVPQCGIGRLRIVKALQQHCLSKQAGAAAEFSFGYFSLTAKEK